MWLESMKSVRRFSAEARDLFFFHKQFKISNRSEIIKTMMVYDDFITEEEESSIMSEVGPYLDRLKYEQDHWDDAIHGYRETERLQWSKKNSSVLDRVKGVAIPDGTTPIKFIHVLDLARDGVIKPHVDSARFCGNTIAGLSLLSDSVMRLIHEKEKDQVVDILLKRRSLYIMRDFARYQLSHGILGPEESFFGELKVSRERRISVICRNEP